MKFKNFDSLTYTFERKGYILPTLKDNKVYKYKRYDNNSPYYNKDNYKVMRLKHKIYGISNMDNELIGDKEFCYISVNEYPCNYTDKDRINLEDVKGVYLWVINNIVVYVGRAASKNQTLKKRFENGYGNITYRNCVYKIKSDGSNVNGQITNLKMNRLVLNCYEDKLSNHHNVKIELYCLEDNNAADIERILIEKNWSNRIHVDNDFYTLMYNSRH